MSLILASASPRRADLLHRAGFRFEVLPASVEELPAVPGTAPDVALRNAERKADFMAASHPESTVIGADTVVELDGMILGKPADPDDALRILMLLSGKRHNVLTGVCIRNASRNIRIIFTDCTGVWFRPFDIDTAKLYMSRVNVLDKAGAYGIQEQGDMLVERIDGLFSNIVGLPVERVAESLRLIGEEPEESAHTNKKESAHE